MSVKHLKIKVKCLAAEAQFIRKEEKECKTLKVEVPVKDRAGNVLRMKTVRKLKARKLAAYNDLRDHRINVVRKVARNTLVAYAFVRGRSADGVVPKDVRKIDFKSVWNMAKKYGPADLQNLPDSHEAVKAYEAKLKEWFGGVFK
jgi:hypothetical protein